MVRIGIRDPATPSSAGPYSPAVRAGETIYVSGQIGQDPATGRLIGEDVAVQTERALENVRRVLHAAGKQLDDVVRVAVYLIDMDSYAEMNQVYKSYFQPPYPARTTVCVAALPLGAAVEIDVVAVHVAETD